MMNQVILSDKCDVIAGQSPPSSAYNTDGDGLPFYQGKADFGEMSPNTRIWCNAPKKIAEPNDILISVRAPVGPTNLCVETSCIGRGLSAIRCGGEVCVSYLNHYMRSIEKRWDLSERGSTFSSITQNDIKNLYIPIPYANDVEKSLAEQRRIAGILDMADAIRKQWHKLLILADEFLKSTFLHMFGDPVTNPKGWNVEPLGTLVTNLDGKRIPVKATDRRNMSGNYPYYGASGIIDYVDSYLFDGTKLLIAEDGANLLARSTPIAFLASGKYWVNNHAHVLEYNGKAVLDYLRMSIEHRDIKEYTTGSAQPKLNQSSLNRIPIPVPPIVLQNRFSEIVKKQRAMVSRAQAAAKEANNLFNCLIKRAFKGELS